MKFYIVYENKSGKILRTGVCPDSMFASQANENEGVMEGNNDIRDDKHFIDIDTKEIKQKNGGG